MNKEMMDYSYPVKKIWVIEAELINKGLKIDAKYDFFDTVGLIGYENLILKYQSRFLEATGIFKPGTKFSDIVDLFYFDSNLRKEVFSLMQMFELRLEAAMIDVISFYVSTDYKIYTAPNNFKIEGEYEGEDGHKPTRNWLRKEIKKITKKEKRVLTPSELIPKMYFHHVVDWYFLLKDDLKRKVALYIQMGPLFDEVKLEETPDTILVDLMLRICSSFRNQAAHEGVIYNYYNDKISLPFKAAYFGGKNIMPEGKQYRFGIGLLLLFSYSVTDRTFFKTFDDGLYKITEEYVKDHYDRVSIIHDMGLDVFGSLDSRFIKLMNQDNN